MYTNQQMLDGISRPGLRIDGLALAALLLIFFIVGQSLLDRFSTDELDGEAKQSNLLEQEQASAPIEPAMPVVPAALDPYAIVYPYDTYWITQGLHGASYGQAAIDLAAGKGAAVKSPINGQVTANYVDEYGNTTLIIENDVYQVTLLHGNFSASLDQTISLGQTVGSEGNNGYTTDMQGRSCRNRDCGYHSHLNIFNKEIQSNMNPLDVLR